MQARSMTLLDYNTTLENGRGLGRLLSKSHTTDRQMAKDSKKLDKADNANNHSPNTLMPDLKDIEDT